MPRIALSLPIGPSRWTKVPNDLLDRRLPELGDTELRILLVLVRQTSGWNRTGQAAALTYRTLAARTGRGSEAIARALASLEARRLIHIRGGRRAPFPKSAASEGGTQQTEDKED